MWRQALAEVADQRFLQMMAKLNACGFIIFFDLELALPTDFEWPADGKLC
jgi:hypothetical protein